MLNVNWETKLSVFESIDATTDNFTQEFMSFKERIPKHITIRPDDKPWVGSITKIHMALVPATK